MPSFKFTVLALIAALGSVAGSLYLSLGLGLLACPLCFYQRTFAFAVLGILIVGAFTKARESGFVNLFAFLPTVAGGLIAAWHTYLDMSGRLICPNGLFGIGTTAQQSLASYILILLALLPGLAFDVRDRKPSAGAVAWSVLLGGAFAYGCIVSSPPPTMPKPEIRDRICHPPVTIEVLPAPEPLKG